MKEAPSAWTLALVTFVCLLVFIPTLGLVRIIDPSDGFYSECAREMLEKRDFLTSHLNYVLYCDKPILNMWLIASSYSIFGVNEFASRLPAALCATAMCVWLFLCSHQFLRARAAVFSTFALASCTLLNAIAHTSLTDVPLCAFSTIAILSLAIWAQFRRVAYFWIGYIALGLAAFDKGPIAFLIVGGTFLLYNLWEQRRLKPLEVLARLRQSRAYFGLALALLVAAPWFVAEHFATHGAFTQHFFVEEHLKRASGQIVLNHTQPCFYYLPILLSGFLPWSYLCFTQAPLLKTLANPASAATMRRKFTALALCWALTVFLGFSLLSGKLPTYILPMMPAVAILSGLQLDTVLRLKARPMFARLASPLPVAALAALFLLPQAMHMNTTLKLFLYGALGLYTVSFAAFVALLPTARAQKAAWQLAILSLVANVILVPTLMLGFYNLHQREYAQLLDRAIFDHAEIIEIVLDHPSAPFYAKRKVAMVNTYLGYATALAQAKGLTEVLSDRKFANFVEMAPHHECLQELGKWRLYKVSDPQHQLLDNYTLLVGKSAAANAELKDKDGH